MGTPAQIATSAAALALCTVAAGSAVLSESKPAELAVTAWPAPSGFTTVAQRKTRGGDFNGDGYRDIAGKIEGDGVFVIYSGPHGPDPERRQFLTPNTLPGPPKKPVDFGTETASADFDHDDYDDLVVTSHSDSGDSPITLVIFYGGEHGLTDRTVSLKVGSTAPKNARVFNLVIGDFGDNGKLDIAVEIESTAVVSFRNVVDRPVHPEINLFRPNTPSVSGYPVIGDFTGDGYSDLVVTWSPGPTGGSRAELQLGTAQGLSTTKTVLADGWIEVDSAVAADVNGDGKDDLITPESWDSATPPRTPIAISVVLGTDHGLGPRHSFLSPCTQEIREIAVGCDFEPGKLAVMPGSPQGIDHARAVVFEQNTPGMPGRHAGGPDWFGHTVTIGDLNADGMADIAIMAHPNTGDRGRLFIFPGSATGPSLQASAMITGGQLGLPHTACLSLGGSLLR
ncbi:VCBS repeat-containing protein [Actinomadura sp. KC06]|uniref:FG-GAP repeat domain-containing protein n=1 Tax=Actinomadura sp. KC06 TaxID=2530369 RepID=UPI001048E3DE|nr:FG-GAP and VCBS repeat-containing protein [Actinomadura sp. KC06]TDD32723.1 VCBS repeat-containing protein [Actinomadura sp. KC06]